MSEWLELELADRLAPVRAPERLWYLVQAPPPVHHTRRRPVKALLLVAAAAAASVWVAAAWRPEAANVRMVGLTANGAESPMACRSCHTD
jgi:ferric-dicitrate binding protein FerR (iron transport regulator)